MKRFLNILVRISLMIPSVALALDVTVDNNITLELSDGTQYTLSPSDMTQFVVNSSNFVFTMPAGAKVNIISSGRKTLANDFSPSVKTECLDSESRLTLSVPPGGSTQTVTVTPGDTCSSAGGNGPVSGGGGGSSSGSTGGGGGGGGGTTASVTPPASPAPAPSTPTPQTIDIEKMTGFKQQIAELQSSISQRLSQARVRSQPVVLFQNNLRRGHNNDDVRRLQELLAGDRTIYPEGIVNGNFGPATQRAVRRFQGKFGIPQTGTVGPMTRQKLNEMFGGANSIPEQPSISLPFSSTVVPPTAAVSQASPELLKSIRDQIQSLQVKLLQQQVKLLQEKIKSLAK